MSQTHLPTIYASDGAKAYRLIHVCAWCSKPANDHLPKEARFTHGICATHKAQVLKRVGKLT